MARCREEEGAAGLLHCAALAGSVGLLCLAGLIGCDGAKPEMPPPDVLFTLVEVRDVPIVEEWVGTTLGYVNADIRAKVQGYLLQQNYRNGAFVEAGELLFEIDPRQFLAALGEAEGQLGQAQAMLGKSNIDVTRLRPLVPKGAVSRQELDNAVQDQLANQAAVRQAQASLEQARLDLGWTKVTSPISGVAGIAVAQVGDLVGSTSKLTVVSQVDPIKVIFPITEAQYLNASRDINRRASGELAVPSLVLNLTLTDGLKYPHPGRFLAANRQVDQRTGTILVEAEFPNADGYLRPGLFARISAAIRIEKDAIVVPQRAVSQTQAGTQVLVVDPDSKAEVRRVTLGPRFDSFWVISEGLKPGERVIVEGLQKARAGAAVNAKAAPASGSSASVPAQAPTAAPSPADRQA